jgi:hypothetical protein
MNITELISKLQKIHSEYNNSDLEIRIQAERYDPLLGSVHVTEYLDDDRLCVLLVGETDWRKKVEEANQGV